MNAAVANAQTLTCWRYDSFSVLIRTPHGIAAKVRDGYTEAGLCIAHSGWGEPRSETQWTLYHWGSGTPLLGLRGMVANVLPFAWDVSRLTDWTAFSLPSGWQQTDPDLDARLRALIAAAPPGLVAWTPDNPPEPRITDEDVRRAWGVQAA